MGWGALRRLRREGELVARKKGWEKEVDERKGTDGRWRRSRKGRWRREERGWRGGVGVMRAVWGQCGLPCTGEASPGLT